MTPEEASVFGAIWFLCLIGLWLFGLLAKIKAPEKPRG
jgi:hypothetical protein